MEQQTDNHGDGIKILFAKVRAALTEPADDEETERRRRQRDETTGQLARFRRWSTRPWINPRTGFKAQGRHPGKRTTQTASATAEIPAEVYDHAAEALEAILDSMNPYHDDEAEVCTPDIAADYQPAPDYPGEIDADCQPPHNYFSLQL